MAMTSGLQSMLTQESVVNKLPKPILNLVSHTVAKCLEVLVDMLVGRNSRNDESWRVNEKRDRFLKK